MIDLTGCKELTNRYGGSEKKTRIAYNGAGYMLKYPDPIRETKNDLSYMNNQYSEYIGCKIFESLEIPVQETFLAKYTPKEDNKTRIVVACKDFVKYDEELVEASKLGLQNYVSDKQIATTIEDVEKVISKIHDVKQDMVTERFWDTFVVDALIGNKDRHLDNWGFLAHRTENIEDSILKGLAPVYDCGSSLSATVSDEKMIEALTDENKFKDLEYNVASVYSLNGQKIFYHKMFQEPVDDLKKAIVRIVPKIDLNKIRDIVYSTEGMSKTRKAYITKALEYRYDNILYPSFEKVLKEEKVKKLSTLSGIIDYIKSELDLGKGLDDVRKDVMKHIQIKDYAGRKVAFRSALKEVEKCSKYKNIIENEYSR